MVYRVYVEKKPGYDTEAAKLKNDIRTFLGIDGLADVRVINRYDVENISGDLFEECRYKVFAEPQLDNTADNIRGLTVPGLGVADFGFVVETIPGKFDQRADSAEQCIQMVSQSERPLVRTAKVYLMYGVLSTEDIAAIKQYVIDPVCEREASVEKPENLEMQYEAKEEVENVIGFRRMIDDQLQGFIESRNLSMDKNDLDVAVHYFRNTEQRDPTITELRVIDTYWSDRYRHTTFDTIIDSVYFEDDHLGKAFQDYIAVRKVIGRGRSVTMMDIATIATRYLKKAGRLDKLEDSDESNTCTVKINVEINGEKEPWLLVFGNKSDNNQTDAEPFGGAARCMGGSIRDTLSGRAYAFAAMRISGSADPTVPASEAVNGGLPERTATSLAADGSSGYLNQAGIPAGIVDEIYHPGFAAGRLEANAVIGASPAFNVRKDRPLPGDIIVLLGGPAGQGETGSAPDEHNIQRLMRNEDATRLIKKCSDISSDGVSVAIGKLADGVEIDLDAVCRKCDWLDGTDIAVSVMHGRLACVLAAENKYLFMNLAADEDLQCVQVGTVTEEPRLVMSWNEKKIVDIPRELLDMKGAEKHIDVTLKASGDWQSTSLYEQDKSFSEQYNKIASDLNTCSRRGLAERFDSTIGSGTVLMPYGGKNQLTPVQAMVHRIPVMNGRTDDCTLMSWGYDPYISDTSPYHGAYLAVIESVAKLIATGASLDEVYLTLHEHYGDPGEEPEKWGRTVASLLGAFEAQCHLGIGAASCERSLVKTTGETDVPPTLVSFAVTTDKIGSIVSPEFKGAGHGVYLLSPEYEKGFNGVGEGLPKPASLKRIWEKTTELIRSGRAIAAYTPARGGIAEAVMKMTYGNGVGFRFVEEAVGGLSLEEIFGYSYGSILLELNDDVDIRSRGINVFKVGETIADKKIIREDETVDIGDLLLLYESKLENVFPVTVDNKAGNIENISHRARSWQVPLFKRSEPKILIPVFPGTNCEYDCERAIRDAGAVPEMMVIRSRTEEEIKESVDKFAKALSDSQVVFIPGGFSGSDEPDGCAKYITAFFRNEAIAEGVTELLDNREGLMCGIGDGFQALIRLGLVPYGRITEPDEESPALTYNSIGQHQSRIVRVRISSNKSPWLRGHEVGEIISAPVSHGAGKFVASDDMVLQMSRRGQIATQYVDLNGNASGDVRFNPNGSVDAIEGITSPDGRVFGKMAHSERIGKGLYKNVEGNYNIKMFENAIKYFK